MNLQFFLALLLTVLPPIELRGGLPVVIDYCLKNDLSIWPYFLIVVFLNCILIFFIYFFMDHLNSIFMRMGFYKKFMNYYISKLRTKINSIEKQMNRWGYVALAIFVAIPLPGTGAWTGTIIAWILALNRTKSFIAISIGVIIAGLIMLGLSLGVLNIFY
jgi:uncharacterized membrane protein